MRRKVVDEKPEKSGVYGSPEEMLDKAKTEYFVRDPEAEMHKEKREYPLCKQKCV